MTNPENPNRAGISNVVGSYVADGVPADLAEVGLLAL
jgi:hypothetical protein